LLTPVDARAAARMDQVMNITDWYLFQGGGNIITFQRVIGPMLFKQPADDAAVSEAMPRGRVVFAELSRLLGDRLWFGGDHFSLADLMVAPHFDFFTSTPEWHELTAPHRNLVDWLARAEARPSLQATTWPKITAMAAIRRSLRFSWTSWRRTSWPGNQAGEKSNCVGVGRAGARLACEGEAVSARACLA
jgi:glutathione S-transferase